MADCMKTVQLALVYILAFYIWCLALIQLVVRAILSPRRATKYFSRVKRENPPQCMNNSNLGVHSYIRLKNVRMHYVAAGNKDNPLMLFLHGFPECWYSWRYQLSEFKKDYRVVAIDMRGYGETDKPAGISNYEISHLTDDLKELIPALGYSSCTLVAHDWGGIVAWWFAAIHSDLVDKLIVMNCPHPKRFKQVLKTNWRQMLKSWYMVGFQMPLLPEFYIRLSDYGAIKGAFKSRSMGVKNRDTITDEDVEAYKYSSSRPGALTAMVNYYRAFLLTRTKMHMPKIVAPTLLIWGDCDGALETSNAQGMEGMVENVTVKIVHGSSHWVQQDYSERVNSLMREFLFG